MAGDTSCGLDPGDLSPVLLPPPGTHEKADGCSWGRAAVVMELPGGD